MNEWIPTTNRPPRHLQSTPTKIVPLLICFTEYTDPYASVGWYMKNVNAWYASGVCPPQNPSHWCEIPPFPKPRGKTLVEVFASEKPKP